MRYFILTALLAATPAAAQQFNTDLELVLLADASGSIDDDELIFQRQSYATAITDPDVLDAISNTLYGSIAVTYVEWAENTAAVVDWTIITDEASATAFAEALIGPPRAVYGRNAIGGALLDGMRMIESNNYVGFRRVIDFSGDTMGNSSGPPITLARDEVVAANITINALPILRNGGFGGDDLVELYTDNIIGGDGAFVVPAETGAAFAESVKRKLVLEIAGLTPETELAAVE